jgi:hypothetical protein
LVVVGRIARGTRRRAAVLLLGLSAGLAVAAAPEYQVKAAFLFNFAKFVDWPEAMLARNSSMNVCVLGDDPFGAILNRTVEGKTVHDRPIRVARLVDAGDVSHCHVLFISVSEQRELPRLLPVLAGLSILTVGETESFVQNGGMIGFTSDADRVRFEINNDAAERAGLHISSQLLKLATRVIQ